jgi:phospholipase/lecithinase/hemolysin
MRKAALHVFFIAIALLRMPCAEALDLKAFQKLVVFGDSLSDNGNSFVATGMPPAPYFDGRWTNGPNWVDYFPFVAHHFLPATAFLRDGGTNFAVGGSPSTNLAAQIGAFLISTGGHAAANDLYAIWIGANDFSDRINPEVTVANIVAGVGLLRDAGATEFLLIDIPDISLTPDIIALGGATVQAAKQFVATVNAALQSKIPLVSSLLGVRIDLININTIFYQLINDPIRFGFTNSTGEAFNPSTGIVAPDPNQYVFWDGFHPTTRVHFIAAAFISRASGLGGFNGLSGVHGASGIREVSGLSGLRGAREVGGISGVKGTAIKMYQRGKAPWL